MRLTHSMRQVGLVRHDQQKSIQGYFRRVLKMVAATRLRFMNGLLGLVMSLQVKADGVPILSNPTLVQKITSGTTL